MRPVSLTLTGFTSYGEPTELYLEPLQLTAITGRNGAGKSSIVDAMLFALFGRGRVNGDIDSTITTGADKAIVVFEFELNGCLWRATRTRQRSKRTTALLEAQDDFGVWQPRSSGTVTDTDKTICNLLGMSLETFLATVVIGQGDADRFCAADPAARKEILGEVLRLGVYQRWAEAAKSRHGDRRATAAATGQRIEAVGAEMASMGDVRKQEVDAKSTLGDLRERLVKAELLVGEAVAAERAAAEAADAMAETEDRLRRARAAHAARVADLRSQVAEAMTRRQRQATRVDQERAQVAACESAAAQATGFRNAAETAAHDALAAGERSELLVTEGQQAREALVGLEAQIAAIAVEREQAVERQAGLQRATEPGVTCNDAAPGCWVCSQPLTAEQAQRMLDELTSEIAGLDQRQAVLTQTRSQTDARVAALRAEYRSAKADRDQAAARAAEAQAAAGRAAAQGDLLEGLRARLAGAEADLAEAAERADTLVRSVADAEQPDPDTAAIEAEVARLKSRSEAFEMLRTQRVALEGEVSRLRTALDEAARMVGVLGERVATLERLTSEREALNASLEAQRKAERDWSQLSRAFGRDGIPALIVASEVAELEEQTNNLLSDLSGGALSIRLATTRLNKSGTTKDTLDITVVGSDGERRYDSYSGGERLRVDIAIRLGLSQMLANRSGTSIKLLIIDEGWGPLDGDGIPALIDCLRILQESGRFSSVYTITHLPEVASAFPQQITVDRGPDGYSAVEVSI